MKKYRVTYDVAGWIEEKIVEARNMKEAKRVARVTRIVKVELIR